MAPYCNACENKSRNLKTPIFVLYWCRKTTTNN
jgi:hypothetical protein